MTSRRGHFFILRFLWLESTGGHWTALTKTPLSPNFDVLFDVTMTKHSSCQSLGTPWRPGVIIVIFWLPSKHTGICLICNCCFQWKWFGAWHSAADIYFGRRKQSWMPSFLCLRNNLDVKFINVLDWKNHKKRELILQTSCNDNDGILKFFIHMDFLNILIAGLGDPRVHLLYSWPGFKSIHSGIIMVWVQINGTSH